MIHHQRGITLIELMVSLVLGLLVSAAALQLLLTGQKTLMVQQGSADVQDGSVFGLARFVDHLQLVNLTNSSNINPINAAQTTSGIALAPVNIVSATNVTMAVVSRGIFTQDNTNIPSDQLTIQYSVPQVVATADLRTHDCEGNVVGASTDLVTPNPRTANIVVTERYFLRLDTTAGSEGYPAYALACKAVAIDQSVRNGTLPVGNANELSQGGQVIIPRVDHFHYLLGVETKSASGPSITYITPQAYTTANLNLPIVSIQISVLIRSQQTTGSSHTDVTSVKMLDQTVTPNVPSNAGLHYVRQVYTRTVMFGNGRIS